MYASQPPLRLWYKGALQINTVSHLTSNQVQRRKKVIKKTQYIQCAVSKIIMATYYQVNKQEFEGIIKRIRVVWQPLNIIIVRKINPATD